jgi:hypothetical protein
MYYDPGVDKAFNRKEYRVPAYKWQRRRRRRPGNLTAICKLIV